MNSPLHTLDDIRAPHRRAGAVASMPAERFELPEAPPNVRVREARGNGRSARFAAIGMVFSLVAHVSLAAWMNRPGDPPSDSVSFAGQTQAIQIEATFVEPAPQSTPEPVQLEIEPPARSYPAFQTTELARQPTESVELVPTDPVAERKVAPAAAPIALGRRAVATADAPPDPARRPKPEPPLPPTRSRQAPPSVAAVPIPPGTQNETPPDYSHNPPPRYPAEALARGWQGVVELRFTVSAVGRVEDVRILRSSGYPILDQAAVEAVSQWRGVAAKRGGQPVASVEELPVVFRRNKRPPNNGAAN